MTHDEFQEVLRGIGESVRWRVPRGAPFALVAWNPATSVMHVWTLAEQDPEVLAALLEDAAETLRDPHQGPRGN